MASHPCVHDLTTRRYVKASQAQKWISDGRYAWVEHGFTVRELTLAEMAVRGMELPAERAEVPGVVTRELDGVRQGLRVAFQATLLLSPKKAQVLAADRIMPLAEFRRLLAKA